MVLQICRALADNRNMLAILNNIEEQIIDALNAVDSPDHFPEYSCWIRHGEFNSERIRAVCQVDGVTLVLRCDGKVEACSRYELLSSQELRQLADYAERCEQAVARLDAGETLVQRRDIDDVLGACVPEFRKTDAFRRLDDALSARE